MMVKYGYMWCSRTYAWHTPLKANTTIQVPKPIVLPVKYKYS